MVVTLIKYFSIPYYLLDFFNLADTPFKENIIAGFFGLTARLGLKGIIEEGSIPIFMTMGPNETGNTLSNPTSNSGTWGTNNTTGTNRGTNRSGSGTHHSGILSTIRPTRNSSVTTYIEEEIMRRDSGNLPSNYGNPIVEWLWRTRVYNMREISLYQEWLAARNHFDERANVRGLMENMAVLEYENYKYKSDINRLLLMPSEENFVELARIRSEISKNNENIYHLKYDPNNINSQLLARYLNERRNY